MSLVNRIKLLQNHIALTSSKQIDNICKPLLRLGINYFSFVRSFKDGSHVRLSNNPDWTQHYYSQGFYNVIIRQIPDKEGNLLWSNIDRYPLFHDASEYFNVDNGTVLVIIADDVIERYFFGSTRENKQVNYIYLHQLDLLKRFVLYFKEVAQPLIDRANKARIVIPVQKAKEEDVGFYSDSLLSDFLNDIRINKVFVRTQGEDVHITPTEAKILSLMKYGYSAKTIAKETGLKEKTIEVYRDNLRAKLKQHSRDRLSSLANANSLLEIKLLK